MVQGIKGLLGGAGLLVLSLYCRGVLAVENAVKAVSSPPDPSALPVPASALAPVVAPGPIVAPNGMPTEYNQHQVLVGSLVGIGNMLLLVTFFWLVINVIRKLAGGQPNFIKPLVLGLIGFCAAYVVPGLLK